ncbi:hypothetical protein TrVE_jg7737 [Triparma verrucosa]|uniref:tRNA-guanine(15) transglycosylase-like domain-containing protein n=1 Tax=Triparma verrucosa TaxID=1606542 RepID=A0A9W7EI73_9STRA|nr:hypothetical protein TrVE_jg7737 [Triparma verrucosa]
MPFRPGFRRLFRSPSTTTKSINNNNNNNNNKGITSAPSRSKTTKAAKARRVAAKIPPLPPPLPSAFPPESFLPKPFFTQEVLHSSSKPGSKARVTRITTPHGSFLTPSFVAVATNGALKALTIPSARKSKQDLIFCNSYHLLLQPGPEVIKEAGGIHKFMGMREDDGTMKPIITDSGGFQVFSLKYGTVYEDLKTDNRSGSFNSDLDPKISQKGTQKVTEEGVIFTSYRDGAKVLLTPESTILAQKDYGSDIIIPLDELPSYDTSLEDLRKSVDLTHRWEGRSLIEHYKNVKNQAIYGVVHGGVSKEIRSQSLEYLSGLPFDGFAVGGSLGGNREEMKEMLEYVMGEYRVIEETKFGRSKPVHLLGIADESSILQTVSLGIDTYDSCFPTRLARHGTLLTRSGKLHIKSSKHSKSYGIPIDEECECETCKRYDRAYLNHLLKAKEPVFYELATQHNLRYMNDLMEGIREKIMNDEI